MPNRPGGDRPHVSWPNIGNNIVVETGLYNLTQEETPVLVHFGPDRVENWLLVRLENPESNTDSQ